jgi:hypothetical protein
MERATYEFQKDKDDKEKAREGEQIGRSLEKGELFEDIRSWMLMMMLRLGSGRAFL